MNLTAMWTPAQCLEVTLFKCYKTTTLSYAAVPKWFALTRQIRGHRVGPKLILFSYQPS